MAPITPSPYDSARSAPFGWSRTPDICCHVRTYRHANRAEGRPTQLDYVYGSEQVLQQLSGCTVLDEAAAWALSDHCPIVIDLCDAD